MSIDLLVVGGSGFVGSRLTQAGIRAGLRVAYTYSSHALQLPAASYQVTIQDGKTLEACIAETQPRNIIYCAVPPPGSDERCHQVVSVEGVQRALAVLDRSRKCKFIYVSTNAVFSGVHGPYRENDAPDPENRQDKYRNYAVTRAQGEQIVLNDWPNSLVARTADVNGKDVGGRLNTRLANLVETLQAGKETERSCHAYISPTLIDHLVAGLLEICADAFDHHGILHLVGSEQISYYDFARFVARQIKADEQLIKAETSTSWNIGLDHTNTQSMLKTRFLGVKEQLSAIFSEAPTGVRRGNP